MVYSLKLALVAFVLASLALVQGTTATAAAGGYHLFGDATLVHPGNASNTAVQLRSVGATYGRVDFDTPSGVTVSQLRNLSTDYMFTAGSCGGGSPRFQINVGGANIFAYIGPSPGYTGCSMNIWLNSGNVLFPFVDTSQLPGGNFYDTWAHAQTAYGSMTITGVQLVADAGWKFGTQTVQVDNVMINSTTYTFDPAPTKDSCKKGGWQSFTSSPGPFKNQGDCVSFFANGKNDSGE